MSLRMSEEEYAEMMARRRRNPSVSYADNSPGRGAKHSTALADSLPAMGAKRTKYGNRRVEIDGMKFDSRHEADYYLTNLLILWKGGRLRLLARQVPFDLPGGIRYIADFVTVDTEGNVRVIDAKSEATRKNRVYINKKKQMMAVWGIEIQEV